MLKTVILIIDKLNKCDSGLESRRYNIVSNFDEFTGEKDEAFLITDSRRACDIASKKGIGFALYLTESGNSESFPDALYCIENLSEMSDEIIERMQLRSLNRPWTILTTKRCIVREITLDDIDDLYKIYSDEETKLYIEDLYPDKAEEIEFTREYILNQYRFYEYGIWVVIEKSTNKLIGRAGLSDRDGYDTTEIGFIFDRNYWGQGYAYEVCSAITEYAKEELMMEKLISFTKKENLRSIHLLERLGFSFSETKNLELGCFNMYVKKLT